MTTAAHSSAGAYAHPEIPTVAVPRLTRIPLPADERPKPLQSWPFLSAHLAAVVGVILVPPSWPAVLLCAGMLWLRILGVTMGYHRYFAHRSFRTSRAFQFVLALCAV